MNNVVDEKTGVVLQKATPPIYDPEKSLQLWIKIQKMREWLGTYISKKGGKVSYNKVNYEYFTNDQLAPALIMGAKENKIMTNSIRRGEFHELWAIDLESGYKEVVKKFPLAFNGLGSDIHKNNAGSETYCTRQMEMHLFKINTTEMRKLDADAEASKPVQQPKKAAPKTVVQPVQQVQAVQAVQAVQQVPKASVQPSATTTPTKDYTIKNLF